MKKERQPTIEEMDRDIAILEKEWNAIIEQIEPLKTQADELYNRIRALRKARDEARIKSGPAMDWPELLRETHGDSMAMVHERDRRLSEIGLRRSGFFLSTNQTCIQILLGRNDGDGIQKALEGIRLLKSILKPLADGFIRFSVFEHTLSEFGIYNAKLSPDKDEAFITKTTYGHESVIFGPASLLEVLTEISKEHWYNRLDD